jgi:predicted phosphoribosyltransferase
MTCRSGAAEESQGPYADRREAGRALAARLGHYAGKPDVVVLGLPRGGVPVAYEVATALDAPLDAFIVRKLGMPGHPEFAMGAIASGGVQVLSDDVIRWYGIPDVAITQVAARERAELERREREYRRGPMIDLRDRIVILVDDGLATGASMRAAVQAVRALGPARVVVAVPVGARQTCEEFGDITDETVCAKMPEQFSAVGQWYLDFSQTSDDEVRSLLDEANRRVSLEATDGWRPDESASSTGRRESA